MPVGLTEKINSLSALVLKDAQNKRAEMLENTEKTYSERMNGQETELLQSAYESVQKNIRASRADSNARVLHAELDARKRLILKREEIIADVMKEARERIAAFAAGDGYENWLVQKTKKAVSELGDGAKTVYLSADDMKYADALGKSIGGITVEESPERSFSGGVKVVNTQRRVAADYSFDELLSEQRGKFLRESGLSLE